MCLADLLQPQVAGQSLLRDPESRRKRFHSCCTKIAESAFPTAQASIQQNPISFLWFLTPGGEAVLHNVRLLLVYLFPCFARCKALWSALLL